MQRGVWCGVGGGGVGCGMAMAGRAIGATAAKQREGHFVGPSCPGCRERCVEVCGDGATHVGLWAHRPSHPLPPPCSWPSPSSLSVCANGETFPLPAPWGACLNMGAINAGPSRSSQAVLLVGGGTVQAPVGTISGPCRWGLPMDPPSGSAAAQCAPPPHRSRSRGASFPCQFHPLHPSEDCLSGGTIAGLQ